jgi:hypothetical protein
MRSEYPQGMQLFQRYSGETHDANASPNAIAAGQQSLCLRNPL